MHFLTIFALGALLTSGVFTAVWAAQLRTGNAGIVDAFFGWSLAGLALLYALLSGGDPLSRALMAGIAGLWGLRLGAYLWRRNAGHAEDARYRKLREQWAAEGGRVDLRMWVFFQYQVIFAMLLSLGLLVVALRPTPPAAWAVLLALGVGLISVIGEALADAQLARFKHDPAQRGKVCRSGLWRYSRHPNYFFEVLHWLAYIPLGWGAPAGWLTLLPPLVMAFLLLKLSGIPTTEAHLSRTKPDYAEYMRTTSAFIPWPPKQPRP